MYPTRTSSVYLAFITFKDARILLRKQAISKPTATASLTVNICGEKSDVAKLNSLNFACAHA